MDQQVVQFIVGTIIVGLLLAWIAIWDRRLSRRPGIENLADTSLKRAFRHTLGWSVLGGLILGAGICWAVASLAGTRVMPQWVPPVAVFLPLAIGMSLVMFAGRPPIQARPGEADRLRRQSRPAHPVNRLV